MGKTIDSDYIDAPEQQTTSGLLVSAGEITDDFDKVSWMELLQDYTNMRNGGAVESTTVAILKYPILRTGYTINHDNELLVKYVQWCLDSLVDSFGKEGGFQELLNHLLLALDYGCSFFEKVYESGIRTPDGRITNRIKRLAPFKAETIFDFYYTDTLIFDGVKHIRRGPDGSQTYIDIPVSKLFFYAHNAEYGDPRGRSELRPARNLYKIKKDILIATARAQQRGAGIPEIKSKKTNLSEADKQKLHQVGRTVGNMKHGYVLTDDDVELKIHGLQIQGSPEAMLEFINREMFFNTLTEFMTSGLGQNGSRAATSEHKSSYELKCGVVTMAVEEKMNALLKEITDISYFGPQKSYPKFRFNAIQNLDIVSVTDSIGKLYEKSVLVKQEGDEEFIRGLFGMPKKVSGASTAVTSTVVANSDGDSELSIGHRCKKHNELSFAKVLSADEQVTFLNKTFDTKGTQDVYKSTQEKAERVLSEIVQRYLDYFVKTVSAGGTPEVKYDVELSNKLNSLYKASYSYGASSVNKEIAKASNTTLASKEPQQVTSMSLRRFSGKLLFNIKTVVEDVVDTEWDESRESLAEFIARKDFANGFKTDRRTLINKTAEGYLDGRADTLSENKDKIELYYYNSILDEHLCDVCSQYTGAVMTFEEAEKMGLVIGRGRVNSGCEGGLNKCRCHLVVYKLKGDFKA